MSNMNAMLKLMLQAKEGQQAVPSPTETLSKTTGDSVMKKLARFKKFAPEPFKEANDPSKAEEWLEELDSVLETLLIEDKERILYTESLLQGEARIWWKMEKQKQEDVELSWKDFHKCLLQRYFSTSERDKRKLEFLYLKQENKTVMQYDRQFHKLSRFAKGLVATEEERINCFVNGLNLTIQKDLALLDLKNHAEALDKALKLERLHDLMKKEQNQEDKKRSYDQEDFQEKNDRAKMSKQDQNDRPQQKVKCSRCGRSHSVKNCFLEKGIYF